MKKSANIISFFKKSSLFEILGYNPQIRLGLVFLLTEFRNMSSLLNILDTNIAHKSICMFFKFLRQCALLHAAAPPQTPQMVFFPL